MVPNFFTSNSFLPYFALLQGLKDGQGADLGFIGRQDFHKGVKVGITWSQSGRHLGAGYQPSRMTTNYSALRRAIIVEVFELFPVEPPVPDRLQGPTNIYE
jgi:hypothetical protein